MSVLKYSDAGVLWCRIGAIAAIVGIAVRFVVWPLRPKFGDNQVALYLEEHEKSLRATVITAVEMQNAGSAAGVLRSPAIIDRLTQNALERVHRAGDGRAIDAGELRTNTAVLASIDRGRAVVHGPRPAGAATRHSTDRDAVEYRRAREFVQHRRRSGQRNGREGR